MTHLLKRAALALALFAGLSFAAPALADCTTATTPNTAGTTANATYEAIIKVCEKAIAATPAGENHIGEVGGNIVKVTANPTVSASPAYSSGDVMGALLTFSNVARVAAGSGLLQSVTLNFKSAQTAATDFVWCGGDNPTGTTLTDNAAVAVAAADYNKCRVVHVTDCTSLGTPSVCTADNLAFPFALTSGTTGYGFLVTRGTPTLASTSDVEVALRILRN